MGFVEDAGAFDHTATPPIRLGLLSTPARRATLGSMATRQDFLTPLSPRAAELFEELRRASSLREELVGRTKHDLAVLGELNAAAERTREEIERAVAYWLPK